MEARRGGRRGETGNAPRQSAGAPRGGPLGSHRGSRRRPEARTTQRGGAQGRLARVCVDEAGCSKNITDACYLIMIIYC